MKTNFIAFTLTAVLAGLTSAQNGLPACAQPCLSKFNNGAEIAGCANLDVKCICSNSSFLNDISCCLVDACNEADKQTSLAYAQNLCKTAGVTDLPTEVSCASSDNSTTPGAASNATGLVLTNSSRPTNTSTTSSSASSSPSPPSNSGLRKEIGLGATLLGGLGAMIAVL